MYTRFELKLINTLRGAFTFFLTCMLLAAATTYAIAHDLPTALLFGICGLAQMAIAIVPPSRSFCPYQNTNDPSIVDSGASCATDFPVKGVKDPEPAQTPVRGR